VQQLYDIKSPVPFGDKSEDDTLGLKLTTAQYLTPGDNSIQGVGVVPDVETVPLLVEKEGDRSWIRLQPSSRKRREVDYEWHLENPAAKHGEKPIETVPFLFVSKTPKKQANHDNADDEPGDDPDDDEVTPEEDEQKPDFLMEFARDLLIQAKSSRRRDLVAQSKSFFDKVRGAEDKKVSQALEKLGVDWSQGPATAGSPELSLVLEPGKGEGKSDGKGEGKSDGKIAAGDTIHVKGVVKNLGKEPAYRVRALLKSDNPVFDENEMVFGRIGPGESKTYDLTVKIPTSSSTRTDVIGATLISQGAQKPEAAELTLNIEGKRRPLFAYTYQTIDDVKGNKDGLVQRGEQVRMLVTVKNIGLGKALHAEAVLRNGAGQEGILISAGRFDAKEIAAGETKTFSFVYEVGSSYQGDDYQLELSVGDTLLGETVSDKVKVKIAPPGATPEAATGLVSLKAGAPLRESASPTALIFGKTSKPSTFKVTGRAAGFTRVELDSGRAGFVANADAQPASGAPSPAFEPVWQVTPPVLAVSAPTVVTGDSVHIKGKAVDDVLVRDVFVRVWNRDAKVPMKKPFYLPNRTTGDRTSLSWEADIPLWPGSNVVQVIARESNDLQSMETVVVLRRADARTIAQPAPVPGTQGQKTAR